ncbi:multidrug export protein MepA [Clostridium homopropionicum DSM 5847]|uniref:Multidrug export protein MepA n=1 Tax=Clostridium homopropionicum DSM 5847 TaxID=1121318 RepID=A0A0L6ZEV4_9CLOT|nr:MATE family efflux transporter [Clostridium homopropionicum]KOA21487.1 multidrug export protein MepA [Clostridium homopropionicum DSM 5847]SFG08126.1 putative efflux protein, MATE family [Clostridium homopropionicum]
MNHLGKTEFILNGDMKKVIIVLSVPIMFNNLIQTLYSLADMYWVSKLGSIEVASTGFVWPVLFLILSIGMGLTIAGTSLISQYLGSKEKNQANKIASQIFLVAIILGLILSIIGYISTPYVIKLMGANSQLYSYSCKYLSIMFLDIPCYFIFLVFGAIRQAEGDTFSPMLLNIIGAITNVILDPILIFKFHMGIGGAAIATIISKVIYMPYVIFLLFMSLERVHIPIKFLRLKRNLILTILKVAVPTCIGQSFSSLGFIFLNSFIVSYGNDTMAAFNIGNNINSIVMMPALGIGTALASVVGQNLGGNRIDRAKLAFKTALCLSTIILVIGGSFLFLFAGNVIKIFVPEAKDMEVIIQGKYYLKIISAGLPLMGIFQVLIGIFQGSGHTIYSMIMEMGRLWFIRLPLILFFKNYTNWGSPSVWYSMMISNGIICLIGIIIYYKGAWQKKIIKMTNTC